MAGGGDGANTHVLEAVIVVCVMLSSVAFVVTLDAPSGATAGVRTALAQRVADILGIMNDTPVFDSPLGNTLLEVAVQECLQNDCSRLEEHVGTLLAEGAGWAAYLSTPDGMHAVRVGREPPGEAVTARRTFEPGWSYQFLATSQSTYNPLLDPLVVYGLPVFSGNTLGQGGNELRISVQGTRVADNAVVRFQDAAATRAVDGSDGAAAVSTFFHDGSGTPLAARDVRATTISAPGVPTGTPVGFSLRVRESGGGVVPVGSMVAIQVPQGWRAVASPASNADWSILSNATDANGTSGASSLIARLVRPLTSGHADLVFQATYAGGRNDHYPFVAALSSGAFAQAGTLVRADAHALAPPFETPLVVASVPRPLGAGVTTSWTLGVHSPDPVHVTRIEIAEGAGEAIFASVAGISGAGAWTSEGDKLVWTGSVFLSRDAPLALVMDVVSAPVAAPVTERAAFVPSVELGNYSARLLTQTAPGLHRGVFPPSDATRSGYEASSGGGLRTVHGALSDTTYRTTPLPGSATYAVGQVVSLQDSLFGSAVAPRERTVKPGGTVTLDVEVQSVAYQLALLGMQPAIEARIYPPWAADDRTPIHTRALYDAAQASGGGPFLAVLDLDGNGVPDSSMVGRETVEVPVPASWLYGPYMVEVRLTWLEGLSGFENGLPVSELLTRTASVYDYFVVEPTHGALPPAPVYDVHLVAWLDDWG